MGADAWRSMIRGYLGGRMARRGLSQVSFQQYAYVLHDFAAHLDKRQVPVESSVDEVAAAVDDWMMSRTWAASTCCTNLGIVRPFLDWAGTRGLVAPGVSARLRNPRRPKLLPRAQTSRQVSLLLQHVPDARGRTIVLLEAQCGLRRGEVAAAMVGDLDLAEATLRVRGKGGKERVAYLSEETVESIQVWLGERGVAPGALISSYDHPGRAVTPTWIGILVGRWMSDAGLKTMPGDGVSGHALRHSAATNMLRGGANIRTVQEALGHENITTTARYLRADNDEVRQAMSSLNYGSRRLRPIPGAAAN